VKQLFKPQLENGAKYLIGTQVKDGGDPMRMGISFSFTVTNPADEWISASLSMNLGTADIPYIIPVANITMEGGMLTILKIPVAIFLKSFPWL